MRVLAASAAAILTASVAPATAAPSPAPRPESRVASNGWSVIPLSDGVYRVSWRSPRAFPLTGDRPTIVKDGVPLGIPRFKKDKRTVRVDVVATEAPNPADLDVMLRGDRLDEPGNDRTSAEATTAPVTRLAPLASDPAVPGTHQVAASDYTLDPVALPGMPEPIEMVGHVVEPADATGGPRPLVLFLHGRHSVCYGSDTDNEAWPCVAPAKEIPSHLGYDYIQRLLASQGYATVSIRVNGINAQDWNLADGGAGARAAIVRRHLDHWVDLATAHHVDLSKVILVGHSRGGEGVDRAALQIPMDAPYRIAGQVLIAPTDFAFQTAPYVPTVTLLPNCDGDVYDLQGQRFTDRARDLTTDDTSLKSSVLVMGANHNFFNTEWTPGVAAAPAWDDWGSKTGFCGTRTSSRLSAAKQRKVGAAYVTGAVRLFASGEQQFLPMFDGPRVRVASAGRADVRTHAIGGGREVRRPDLDASLSAPQGATTRMCQGVMDDPGANPAGCPQTWLEGNAPHWNTPGDPTPPTINYEQTWRRSGQAGGLTFATPLDLTGRRLEARTIVDPRLGNVRLKVRLTDSVGGTAVVTPTNRGRLPVLPHGRSVNKRWAQTLVADPARVSGIDLSSIHKVEFVAASRKGRIWVLDLSSAPSTLAAVPNKRMPRVSIGQVTQDEGDGPGTVTAQVPYTVHGDLTNDAKVTLLTVSAELDQAITQVLTIPEGQHNGTVAINYTANTLDDRSPRGYGLAAFALNDVMTDDYIGGLTVIDDDPSPTMTLTAQPDQITEGQSIDLRLELGAPIGFDMGATGTIIDNPHGEAPVRLRDLPLAWRQANGVAKLKGSTPLSQTGIYIGLWVPVGETSTTASLPTLKDTVAEGTRMITFELTMDNGEMITKSITVTD